MAERSLANRAYDYFAELLRKNLPCVRIGTKLLDEAPDLKTMICTGLELDELCGASIRELDSIFICTMKLNHTEEHFGRTLDEGIEPKQIQPPGIEI